jgi:small subunit ribosomal protein S14
MAKKSKIAKNDRRQEIVARYAERRAELKEIIRGGSCAGSRATPARRACATGTRWTGVRAGTSGPSDCPG